MVSRICHYDHNNCVRGIVLAKDRTLLKENNGYIDLTVTWGHSIHQRIGFVRRKYTTAKTPVSASFLKEVGFTFYRQIDDMVSAYNIPHDLIINIDKTPLPFVLVSNYNLAPKGDKKSGNKQLYWLSADHRNIWY